jgi:putative ABC transport system permease protein
MRPERWIYALPLRLRSLFRRCRVDQELDDELRYHVERKTEEYVSKGMPPEEARRAALLEMGGIEKRKEECRDARRVNWLQDLAQDLRYGLRMLRKSPGFTAVEVLTLALGIGANTAVFTVANAFLLRPLPFKDPDGLVVVYGTQATIPRGPASFVEFEEWRQQARAFDAMSALSYTAFNFVGRHEPHQIRGAQVSEGFFRLLGVSPYLGRDFYLAEHKPGSGNVAIMSYELWQREFAGDQGVIGRVLMLNGTAYSVIGVMPPQSGQINWGSATDLWIPLEPKPLWKDLGHHYLVVLARLKHGVTLQRAQTEMDVIAEHLGSNRAVRLVPLRETLVGGTEKGMVLLLAAVGFVLLIACANVTNILLARVSGRTKEFAIRQAVGARTTRLFCQILTESILLALLGGISALVLGVWLTHLAARLWPPNVPHPQDIGLDWRVLVFAEAISLLAGILLGLAPAARACRANLNELLKEGSRPATTMLGRRRIPDLLVVSELALATVLLVGGGLLLKSYASLENVKPGFQAQKLLTLNVYLPSSRYPDNSKRASFFEQALERIKGLPSVQSAGASVTLPLSGDWWTADFSIEGRPFPADQQPVAERESVSPDYFRTMGIPLLKGRLFTEEDRDGKLPAVIINQTMATRFWPGVDPIGKRLLGLTDKYEWQEIVGVVGDVKHDGLDSASGLQTYVPYLQVPSSWMAIVVRTTSDPHSLVSSVSRQIYAVDREQPVVKVRTMEEILSDSIADRRTSAFLLGAFAAVACLLAAVGIYAVISHSVTQRTHEIGVRMAMGAQEADTLKLVVGQGFRLALTGTGMGLAASLATTRLLQAMLFGIKPTDPATFLAVGLLLPGVALLACYIPARRAVRVDPIVALRQE